MEIKRVETLILYLYILWPFFISARNGNGQNLKTSDVFLMSYLQSSYYSTDLFIITNIPFIPRSLFCNPIY